MSAKLFTLAMEMSPVIEANIGWIIAGLVLLLLLLVVGFKDLIRFRWRRVWAISGVCFDESIRRRILWITPLAILGVVIVAQLQQPVDEQDAIRQTTKFCLFATGLVVAISVIILAATSLPREIENRVIYTVVTKPTTRLEIVLGKITGFARVAAVILLIMGFFSWIYLQVRARQLNNGISERLANNSVEPLSRPTLEHYRDYGLLNAKNLASATHMDIYDRVPELPESRRYISSEGAALVPFTLPADRASDTSGDTNNELVGMVIQVRVGYEPAPSPAATRPGAVPTPPQITVQVADSNQSAALTQEIAGGKPIGLNQPLGTTVQIPVGMVPVNSIAKMPYFYVAVFPADTSMRYWIDRESIKLIIPIKGQTQPRVIDPADANNSSGPTTVFIGRLGTEGQQIRGGLNNQGPVCVYHFKGLNVNTNSSTVPLEMRVGIEKGGEGRVDVDVPTHMDMQVRNRVSGALFDVGDLTPENNRTVYTSIPTSAVASGDFDVIIHCLTPEDWLAFTPTTLSVVSAEDSFAFNLIKSLFITWMLAVLIIAIAIFSSTFLSWPIAIVLTLLILLGHWGVEELGDAASAGLGRQFVQDFGVRDPAEAQALSTTVEQLNKVLTTLAVVLPDINQFSATEDIERGITISSQRLTDAFFALCWFGIPLTVLAYIFLKYKEVAP